MEKKSNNKNGLRFDHTLFLSLCYADNSISYVHDVESFRAKELSWSFSHQTKKTKILNIKQLDYELEISIAR